MSASVMERASQLMRSIVESEEQKDRNAADTLAATEYAALKAFDRDPKALRTARAEMEKAIAVVAKAQTQLAVARAAHNDAYVTFNRLQNDLTREHVRLRRASVAPWRLARARERIHEAIEAFRANRNNWPAASKALPAVFEAQGYLGMLYEGAHDPPDDIDAYVDDVLRVLAEGTETALQEHEELVKKSEQKRRTQRLFNP